jgi:hypothetical protein
VDEDHVLEEGRVERGAAVVGAVELGEGDAASRREVVARVLAHEQERHDGRPGGGERVLVDVGRDDLDAGEEPGLREADAERPDLLAGRAPRDPDGRGRGAERREHLGPERAEERGVAEHRRRAHGEVRRHPVPEPVVVPPAAQAVAQAREAREPLLRRSPPEAAGERPAVVARAVDAHAAAHLVEDRVELGVVRLGPVALALATGVGHRWSQTRRSDRSWSWSTGFET